jgi:hypothetical protein
MVASPSSIGLEVAAAAARLIVDEGLDYANAKRKAARGITHGTRNLPSDEVVEDRVREHLSIFHADSQPRELALLRQTALSWMTRLSAWNPHLAGAAWRGTATARSIVRIELYADDTKLAQFALLDLGIDGHAPEMPGRERADAVLSKTMRVHGIDDPVTIDFVVFDADDIRGALEADSRGRRWRGDVRALRALIEAEHPVAAPAPARRA